MEPRFRGERELNRSDLPGGGSPGWEEPAPFPEAELVSRARRGDRSAFERLYRRHVGSVYAICLRLCRDVEEAETLTQDAFVRAWLKLRGFEGRGAFGGWLRRIAVRLVVEERRRGARRAKLFAPPSPRREDGALPGGGPPPHEDAIDLERAIAALPAGAREVFVLHDVNGYRHEEIAAMLGIAVGTAKSQLHRARRLLRDALGED
jgi:RNA polymerase sigma-70 factor (ECF subfamily)